jgi:hypothetical protein
MQEGTLNICLVLLFLESKEQAAVAKVTPPRILNPKLDSLLFTYSLALDFLPIHLKPEPSFSLRTRLRQTKFTPSKLSTWKETSFCQI